MGLQASSRFSNRIRRLNLGRGLVVLVVVDKIIDVEGVRDVVVVVSQMINVKIRGVVGREDPSVNESIIWQRGLRIVEKAPEAVCRNRVVAKSWEIIEAMAGVECIQGRCSSD